ncbi:hypothetical protein [Pseudoalteromonas 'SMAR']|uniref:hypothetical protein n=1 Tax=Pseudoalteromonas 'SMAR' TaxID=3416908 RepID=UPI003AF29F4E
MKEKATSYLYQSVTDIQNTIRAFDVKLGFLFMVIFLPLVGLKDLVPLLQVLIDKSLYIVLLSASFVSWLFALYFLFLGVRPINNPKEYIKGDTPKGTFYAGGLYTFKKIDYFLNFPIKTNNDMENFIKLLPQSDDDIHKELVFEIHKLAYIRDVKAKRTTACVYSILVCGFISVLTIIFVTLKIGGI